MVIFYRREINVRNFFRPTKRLGEITISGRALGEDEAMIHVPPEPGVTPDLKKHQHGSPYENQIVWKPDYF
jgi:hypothetical protein